MDDVPEGPGSVPTHSNTEALSVGMRQHWCGQGPAWVSQRCRTNTCLDFYHKTPSGPAVNEPRDCYAAFTLGAPDLRVKRRDHGVSEWEVKQTDVLAQDMVGCFYVLQAPDVYSTLAAAQHSSTLYPPSFSHSYKNILTMKLKSKSFKSICLFVSFCNLHRQYKPFQIILANDLWEDW